MKFLNAKEQVINVELTQCGKLLLSKGDFKPVFYSFIDDSVLYDTEFAGFTEEQNSAEDRIKQSPQFTAQYIFQGLDASSNSNIEDVIESLGSLSLPIGNLSLDSVSAPAFNIKYLNGMLTSSISYNSSSYHSPIRIPQLSSSIVYKSFMREDLEGEGKYKNSEQNFIINDDKIIRVFEDGTSIEVEKDYLLLQVEEENVPFQSENFEIEVFLCEDVSNGKISGKKQEQLIPLSFIKKEDEINSSNIYKEPEDVEEGIQDLDSTYVGYYMDINVDEEIEKSFLCKGKKEEQIKNIFSDKTVIDCRDIPEEMEDIYKRKIDKFEDCE